MIRWDPAIGGRSRKLDSPRQFCSRRCLWPQLHLRLPMRVADAAAMVADTSAGSTAAASGLAWAWRSASRSLGLRITRRPITLPFTTRRLTTSRLLLTLQSTVTLNRTRRRSSIHSPRIRRKVRHQCSRPAAPGTSARDRTAITRMCGNVLEGGSRYRPSHPGASARFAHVRLFRTWGT